MIERERQIASIFGITIGIILLLIVPSLIADKEPGEANPVDRSELNIPEQVCESILLPDDISEFRRIALLCVNDQFEIQSNVEFLNDEDYDRIIKPVMDSLRQEAAKKGMNPKIWRK